MHNLIDFVIGNKELFILDCFNCITTDRHALVCNRHEYECLNEVEY